jgi:two-component system response regulator AlgR
LRTREREHLIEESLSALEREFAARFVRIHRNCLVAKAAIRGFERAAEGDEEAHWAVVLEGISEKLPVSRRQWSAVKAVVGEGE